MKMKMKMPLTVDKNDDLSVIYRCFVGLGLNSMYKISYFDYNDYRCDCLLFFSY